MRQPAVQLSQLDCPDYPDYPALNGDVLRGNGYRLYCAVGWLEGNHTVLEEEVL